MSNFVEILSILTSAVLIVWLFRRLNLPAILAYLVAGMLVGDHGFSLITEQTNYEHVAELGIVFLLFTLGLEFSLPRLISMRHLVVSVGSLQVILSLLIFTAIAFALGQNIASSITIGAILALSSTAIVIRQLSESGAMKRKSGQISVAILLFQDVAVVPFLIVIPLLALGTGSGMMTELLFALIKGIFIVSLLLLSGKWLLPRLFHLVAQVRTDELFVLTTLLVTLVAAGLTQWFGLSMALGAFLAGMMLGESQYKHQLEADIRPYRDILLGLFFVTVGMKLDVSILLSQPLTVFFVMISFMAIKVIVIKLLAVLAGESKKDGWASGFMLAQMGEFGFVIIALATQINVLPPSIASIILVSGVISMSITPYMIENARRWGMWLSKEKAVCHEGLEQLPANQDLSEHVIICGFGRVGQTVSRFLKQDDIPFVAIDIDPLRTTKARQAGENVLFGSSRQAELLNAAHLSQAKLVVIAFGEDKQSIEVIKKIRSLSPKVPILVRTRNDDQLASLQEAGADEVVPESLEGSLMLVSQVLSLSGIAFSRILKRVQTERKNHYNHLHGFFQGENTDMSLDGEKKIEFAHAILLSENSYANNYSIASLRLEESKVSLIKLIRDKNEIESPEESTILMAQDTIVVRGKPYRVEKFERFIQEGK